MQIYKLFGICKKHCTEKWYSEGLGIGKNTVPKNGTVLNWGLPAAVSGVGFFLG